jgi:hypothetical protein
MNSVIAVILLVILMVITYHLVLYKDKNDHLYLPKIIDKTASANTFSPEELYIKEHSDNDLSFLDSF